MILACGACAAQNFVSPERRTAAHIPPACWKCGAALPLPSDDGCGTGESEGGGTASEETGGDRNA